MFIHRSLKPGDFATTFVGTPLYLSPELIAEKPYDNKVRKQTTNTYNKVYFACSYTRHIYIKVIKLKPFSLYSVFCGGFCAVFLRVSYKLSHSCGVSPHSFPFFSIPTSSTSLTPWSHISC